MRLTRELLPYAITVILAVSIWLVAGQVINRNPIGMEATNIISTYLCPGDWLEFDLTIVTHQPGVVQVLDEWEGDGYFGVGTSYMAINESERLGWQFWTEPDVNTFPWRVQVPEDAPYGEDVQYQRASIQFGGEANILIVPIQIKPEYQCLEYGD